MYYNLQEHFWGFGEAHKTSKINPIDLKKAASRWEGKKDRLLKFQIQRANVRRERQVSKSRFWSISQFHKNMPDFLFLKIYAESQLKCVKCVEITHLTLNCTKYKFLHVWRTSKFFINKSIFWRYNHRIFLARFSTKLVKMPWRQDHFFKSFAPYGRHSCF